MAPICSTGNILHIDLTNRTTWVENPPDSFYRKYGGGSAMGVYYLLKGMPAGVDPLSPQNILTLFTGIPTGLPISGQSRLNANARSPLTGAVGDGQCGGFLPAMVKFSGFDGLVINGRADRPVYIWIHDGQVEIRDAGHLWGKTTGVVEDMLKEELDNPKIEVLQIGPAGENLVRFAAIINMVNRANGRTGMGAVMGSKNLKAIAFYGKHKLNPADPRKLSQMFREGTKNIPNYPSVERMHILGTTGGLSGHNLAGGLPTRNYNEGQFEGYESISGERMVETILTRRDTCFSCTVRCKRVVETEFNGRQVSERYGGPEFETMATFGSYCGNDNMHAVALANQLCNWYGMDTISCGATISFAMECFEKGLITSEDTDGIDLRYGNAEAIVQMVERIALRQGFGDILAEGSERAARHIGKGAEQFLITSKGQEAPAHMPQRKKTMGIIYAVNPFGADHESSEHDGSIEEGAGELAQSRLAELGLTELQPKNSLNDGKARFVAVTQRLYSALDTFGLCSFVYGIGWQLYGPAQTVEMLQAATGWDWTLEEYLQVGERRINLMRAFNAREGFTRDDDTLPAKFFKPLQGTGSYAGVHFDHDQFEKIKDAYYHHQGWEGNTGNPSRQKLESLGLEWING